MSASHIRRDGAAAPDVEKEKTLRSNHDGDIKQYIILSEAWYGEANLRPQLRPDMKPYLRKVDNVEFGFYAPDGGTSGEMGVNWYQLESDGSPVLCLEVFNDAWRALAQFKDVIDALAEVDGQDITPQQFCAILDRCGFVDATPRERKERRRTQ